MTYPNNGQGFGPTTHPVGLFKGEMVYADFFAFGNYWIAYWLSQQFVGAGDSPGLARNDFVNTANQVAATSSST